MAVNIPRCWTLPQCTVSTPALTKVVVAICKPFELQTCLLCRGHMWEPVKSVKGMHACTRLRYTDEPTDGSMRTLQY